MTTLGKLTARFIAAGFFAFALASGPVWADEGQGLSGGEAAAAAGVSDTEVSRFLESLSSTPEARPATDYQCDVPPCETDGGGATSCAVRCPDGSWSSIGCNSNETAHCSCSGYPLQARPYCTRNAS